MSVFLGIHHASFIVADTEQALSFYEGVLGLNQAARPALNFPGAWIDVGGGQQIHLLQLTNPDPTAERPVHGGRDRHVALLVSNLNEVRERLEQASARFTKSSSGRKALFCSDPDGNVIEIIAID